MCTIITWTKLKEHTAKLNAFLSVIIYSFTELWTKLNEDTTELNSFLNCVLRRLQNSRFRKAGSAVSVILECEARETHTPAGRVRRESLTILPRRFFTRSSLSFEYGPSLAFAKNTAVLQSMCCVRNELSV